jgi:hypothetical protein
MFALIAASGCGSSSSSGGLGSALEYVPKDAPLVIVFNTDPKGAQYQQLDKLLGKFPFGGQIKASIRTAIEQRGGYSYDKLKKTLGNDAVLAITDRAGFKESTATPPFVFAWKIKGTEDDATKAITTPNAVKVGKIGDLLVYRSGDGAFLTAKDGVVVEAGSMDRLRTALKTPDGDHMSVGQFHDALGDLDRDALIRGEGDFQAILDGGAGPNAASVRKVKWLGALRTFSFSLSAEKDGIASAFAVKTAGGLSAGDLPIAEGDQAAPVVRRAGELGFGVRDPAQIVRFGEAAAQATDPAGYAKYRRNKATLSKQLGADVDDDLIGQLTGNAAVSISLSGGFALRADLRDPAAAEATLKKVAPRLVKISKGRSVGLSTPKGGKGFYALAQANGDKVVFGVVGKTFVAASDASRAAQVAGQSPSVVPGAKGAFVLASDARALANAVAEQRGQGTAARIVTGALGDLIGSMRADTGGLTSELKLQIK